MKLHQLDRDTLIELIEMYDDYIQNANDEDSYRSGWRPVCIEEFLNCEFAEEDYDEEDYE